MSSNVDLVMASERKSSMIKTADGVCERGERQYYYCSDFDGKQTYQRSNQLRLHTIIRRFTSVFLRMNLPSQAYDSDDSADAKIAIFRHSSPSS